MSNVEIITVGDTVRWRRNKLPRVNTYGLVVEAGDPLSVRVEVPTSLGGARYTIGRQRINGHWPGRAEFDRRMV
jgi:hypothetical protein